MSIRKRIEECKETALKYLDKGDHSSKEVMEFLLKKKYSEEEAEEAVALLLKSRALNDERFADNYVYGALERGKTIKKSA